MPAGAGLVLAHRDRIRNQAGAGANTTVKTVVTVAALATTAYSGELGAKLAPRSAARRPAQERPVTGHDASPQQPGHLRRHQNGPVAVLINDVVFSAGPPPSSS